MPAGVTQLVVRWSAGDGAALHELMPIVYNELRRLARSAVRRDGRVSVLQPTALVHEVWLRLAGKENLSVESRGQFYALAAKMMRDVLVDHLRRRRAAKRGGLQIQVPLQDGTAPARAQHVEILMLDEALTRLGEIKPRYVQIAELRYLAGLTIEQTAEVLNVSHATIEREWVLSRAWLRRELRGAASGASEAQAPQ
jgi:RNA polymerase sigma-70 factor, ECF subfamily